MGCWIRCVCVADAIGLTRDARHSSASFDERLRDSSCTPGLMSLLLPASPRNVNCLLESARPVS